MDQGKRRGRRPKRIAAVCWLVTEHRDAVELLLIEHGLRLRMLGHGLSFNDLYILCAHAPEGSALAGEIDPAAKWTHRDYMLWSMEYSLRWLAWSKTKDAQHKRHRPEPLPTPGKRKDTNSGRFTDIQPMSVDEMREYLKRPRHAIRKK